MFVEAKNDGGDGVNWTTGAVSRAKLHSNRHNQKPTSSFFTGRMPFPSPNQQSQSTVCISALYNNDCVRSLGMQIDSNSLTLTLSLAHLNTKAVGCDIVANCYCVMNMRKYERGLHHTMRHDLHWLDMTDHIQFRIAVTVYRCLHGTDPEYPSELFVPVSTKSSRHCLRSSDSNKLVG